LLRRKIELLGAAKPANLSTQEYVQTFKNLQTRLLKLDPSSHSFTKIAYNVYSKANDAVSARECLEQLKTEDEEFASSELAWLLFSESDDAESIQEATVLLNRAVELNPSNVQARTRLGTLLFKAGDQGTAQMRWLQALKLDPQNPDLFYCIALHTYFVKGDSKKAAACLEKALAYRPNFKQAAYLQCVIAAE